MSVDSSPTDRQPQPTIDTTVPHSARIWNYWLGTKVVEAERVEQAQQDYNESGAIPYALRTPEEIASFFTGLELVEPGIVSCPLWRPEPDAGTPTALDAFGGVGRKP